MDAYREMDSERDIEREYNLESELGNKERMEVRVVSNEHVEYLKEKYKHDDRRLRVYHDEVNDRYYIDTFAAFALGFLSYHDACDRFDCGGLLYEISKQTFERLKEVFPGKIVIQVLYVEKEEENVRFRMVPNSIDDILQEYDIYNNIKKFDNQIKYDKLNYNLFGDDILNKYKKEKSQSFDGDVDFPIENDSIEDKKELFRMYEETLNKIDDSNKYGNNKK